MHLRGQKCEPPKIIDLEKHNSKRPALPKNKDDKEMKSDLEKAKPKKKEPDENKLFV